MVRTGRACTSVMDRLKYSQSHIESKKVAVGHHPCIKQRDYEDKVLLERATVCSYSHSCPRYMVVD